MAVAEQVGDAQLAPIGGDGGVVREQRRPQRRRVCRDAGAQVEQCAVAVVAGAGGAVATALLQAGGLRMPVVPAAVVLQKAATDSADTADLRGGQGSRREGERRVVGP